jgi:type VII secretion-associated serine protease mycosin
MMRWRAAAVAVTALLTVLTAARPALALGPAPQASPALARDTIRQMQWYLGSVKASAAQQVTRGNGVVVAVIDSGVDAGHPDLAGAVLPGASFGGADSQNGRTDPDGHGTKMAGVIAARGGGQNNALGIAPGARILPVAVRTSGTTGSMAEAIRWAVDHDAQVINLSIARPGGQPLPSGEAEAIAYAIQRDVVVVAGAGNRSELPSGNALAMLPGVVAVSGLGRSGQLWSGSVRGEYVAVSAPAEDIVNIGARNIHNTGYSTGSGTSDSTAMVSGVVALIRAKFPRLDAANVINRLIRTAVDRGSPGRDPLYGFGALDAQRAVTRAVAAVDANPLGQAAASNPPTAAAPGPGPGGADDQADGGRLLILVVIGVVVLFGLALLILVIWLVVRASRPKRGPPPPPAPYAGYASGYPPYQAPPHGQPPRVPPPPRP